MTHRQWVGGQFLILLGQDWFSQCSTEGKIQQCWYNEQIIITSAMWLIHSFAEREQDNIHFDPLNKGMFHKRFINLVMWSALKIKLTYMYSFDNHFYPKRHTRNEAMTLSLLASNLYVHHVIMCLLEQPACWFSAARRASKTTHLGTLWIQLNFWGM